MVGVLADMLVADGARPSAGTAEYNVCTEQLSNTSLWASHKLITPLFGIGCNNFKVSNNKMKGQSEIAYLPKFANMYILLIVLVIVITE